MGHGAEKTQEFEARDRIPPGYTLVTYAQCGSVTYTHTVVELVKAFSDPANKEILENPTSDLLELKRVLNGLETHVYTEGMYYPSATLYLFAYWMESIEVKNVQQENQIAISKSGVYDFPLNIDTWTLQPGGSEYTTKSMFTTLNLKGKRSGFKDYNTIKNAEELAAKSYTDSIFPTPAEAATISVSVENNLEKFKEATKYSLETIFQKGGPGVYYHFVCREPTDIGLTQYTNSFGNNAGIPEHNYEKYYPINSIPTLLPYMQSYAETRHEKFKRNLKRLLAEKNRNPTNAELSEIAMAIRNSPTAKNNYGLTNSDMYSLFSWNYKNVVKAPAKFQRAYNIIHNTRRKSINQQSKHATKSNRGGGNRSHRSRRKCSRS